MKQWLPQPHVGSIWHISPCPRGTFDEGVVGLGPGVAVVRGEDANRLFVGLQ